MQIKCDFYSYESSKWQQYEIDLDLNVFPCCHYYIEYSNPNPEHPVGELYGPIKNINKNLKTNSLENIFKEYSKVLNEEIWKNGKTCPPLCMKICQKK